MSSYAKVKEFTFASNQHMEKKPVVLRKKELYLVSKTILSGLAELLSTSYHPEEVRYILKKIISESKNIPKLTYENDNDNILQISDQAGALVDIEYCILHTACKNGIDLKPLFDVVHDANMAKRDPTFGVFLRGEDGKIIKPRGWLPPDLKYEIQKQFELLN